jgi:hypothetical protein
MSITHFVCAVVALGIQHAMLMRHVVIFGQSLLYNIFPHYLIRVQFSKQKKSIVHKSVFRVSLQLLSETFFILIKTERDMIEKVYWS